MFEGGACVDTLTLAAQLADVKDVEYRNTLALASLIELLVEKGVLERGEIAVRAERLDMEAEIEAAVLARDDLWAAPPGPGLL
jgi:hypothetical protein